MQGKESKYMSIVSYVSQNANGAIEMLHKEHFTTKTHLDELKGYIQERSGLEEALITNILTVENK